MRARMEKCKPLSGGLPVTNSPGRHPRIFFFLNTCILYGKNAIFHVRLVDEMRLVNEMRLIAQVEGHGCV